MKKPWIGGKDFHNFYWIKRTSSYELGEKSLWGASSCVIFLGKERRRMMSLSRWWKERE
jgi:hypothetical protein